MATVLLSFCTLLAGVIAPTTTLTGQSAEDLITSNHLNGHVQDEPMAIRLAAVDIRNMSASSINQLKELTSKHGVIVVQNAGDPLSSDELLHFASRFGDPISLPNGFGFNSTDKAHALESFVTNITNMDPVTGEAKTVTTAEYLHNDGDFWENNYIFSFLYGEVIPDRGGHTQFIDLQRGHDLLRDQHPDLYETVNGQYVIVDVNNIPDFRGSPFLDKFNAEHEIARHSIVDVHRVTNRPVLFYGCKFAEIEGFGVDRSFEILSAIDDVLRSAAKEGGPISYVHEWNEGDLVIWDNTRVMHASLGGYESRPRKLWRVEAHI